MKLKLAIKRIERSTPDSITLFFDKVEGIAHHKPGQHLSLSLSIDNETVSRTYSFNSSPFTDRDVSITVRLIPGGKLSSYLVNHVKEGEQVTLEGPFGNFVIEPGHENKRHLIMFAAGSGITPLMSMIKSILHGEPMSRVSLIYSNHSTDRIIFKTELQRLHKHYAERFKVLHVITQPLELDDDLRVFYKGQLSKLIVRKLTKNLKSESPLSTEVYLCGPHGFMKMIEEAIASLNLTIHKEHFFIPIEDSTGYNFGSLPPREVLIKWSDQEYLVNVASGEPILMAALRADLKLPHSCKEGQCGTCRSILVSGEVKLRKNHILTAEELQQSQILICQAYPVSEDVAIRTMS